MDSRDPRATANRLRAAAESLTDPHDIRTVAQYLAELDKLAAEQEAEASEPKLGLDQRFKHARLRALRR